MTNQEMPPPLEDLDRRLGDARASRGSPGLDGRAKRAPLTGLGLGLRLGTELAAGTVVGVGIGWGLDHLMGTQPWATVLFGVLGWVAGVLNAYRAARGMDETVGFGAAASRRFAPSEDEGKGTEGGQSD